MVLDCWTCWTQSAMVSTGTGRSPIWKPVWENDMCISDIRDLSRNPWKVSQNQSPQDSFTRQERRGVVTSHFNCDEGVAKDPGKNYQGTLYHQMRTIRISHRERGPKVRWVSSERASCLEHLFIVQPSYTIADIPDHSWDWNTPYRSLYHAGAIWSCWGLNPVWSWQDGRPQILNGWDCLLRMKVDPHFFLKRCIVVLDVQGNLAFNYNDSVEQRKFPFGKVSLHVAF